MFATLLIINWLLIFKSNASDCWKYIDYEEGDRYIIDKELLETLNTLLLTIDIEGEEDGEYCKIMNMTDGSIIGDATSCYDHDIWGWTPSDNDPTNFTVLEVAHQSWDHTTHMQFSRNNESFELVFDAGKYYKIYDLFTLSEYDTTFLYTASKSAYSPTSSYNSFGMNALVFDDEDSNNFTFYKNINLIGDAWIEYEPKWIDGWNDNEANVWESIHLVELPVESYSGSCDNSLIASYAIDFMENEINFVANTILYDPLVDEEGQKIFTDDWRLTKVRVYDLRTEEEQTFYPDLSGNRSNGFRLDASISFFCAVICFVFVDA